eukprot:GHVL01037227.1.p1 GENE.GHVL01037227.1~~GHVL01037227.1.p1  ORF type:complete len:372 (+),score=72.54 GHVL01037227.1:252-1367(+)
MTLTGKTHLRIYIKATTLYMSLQEHNIVPWMSVLGNHDHYGNPKAQIEASYIHPYWHMPYYWYSEIIKDNNICILLIFIDTELLNPEYNNDTRIGQLYWIEKQLINTKCDWNIVIGHHPIYSSGYHKDTIYLNIDLKPLLEYYNVDLYISGHDHHLEFLRNHTLDTILNCEYNHTIICDNLIGDIKNDQWYADLPSSVSYIISGAGSQPQDRELDKKRHILSNWGKEANGFTAHTVNATMLSTKFIDSEGRVIFEHNQKKQKISNHKVEKSFVKFTEFVPSRKSRFCGTIRIIFQIILFIFAICGWCLYITNVGYLRIKNFIFQKCLFFHKDLKRSRTNEENDVLNEFKKRTDGDMSRLIGRQTDGDVTPV